MTARPKHTDAYLIDFRERTLDQVLEEVERRTILNALNRTEGQRNKAAKLMGISRSRLYRRLDALNIKLNDAR